MSLGRTRPTVGPAPAFAGVPVPVPRPAPTVMPKLKGRSAKVAEKEIRAEKVRLSKRVVCPAVPKGYVRNDQYVKA